MRTTIDIDDPILRDLKKLQRKTGKALGRLVSDFVAEAMASYPAEAAPPAFSWNAKKMGARFDLADKDALYAALDGAMIERPDGPK